MITIEQVDAVLDVAERMLAEQRRLTKELLTAGMPALSQGHRDSVRHRPLGLTRLRPTRTATHRNWRGNHEMTETSRRQSRRPDRASAQNRSPR